MRKMKKILLAVISLLPVLTYGQSMKIDPKQLMPGADGNVIITRNGVNTLDNIDWSDINNVPSDLERTSNKVTDLNSPNNVTYPTTQAVSNALLGKVSTGNSPATTVIKTSVDVDTLYGSRFISVNSTSINTPSTSNWFHIIQSSSNNNSLSNTFRLFGSPDANDMFYYQRGSWGSNPIGPYYRVASREWVTAQNYLTAETDPVYTDDKNNLVRKYTTNDVFSNFPNNANYQGSVVESTASSSNLPSGEGYFTGINLMPNHNGNYRSIVGVATSGKFYIAKYSNSTSSWSWRRMITEGDDNTLLNNAAGYITSSSIPAAQTLSLSGQNLSLSGGGGTVALPNTTALYFSFVLYISS